MSSTHWYIFLLWKLLSQENTSTKTSLLEKKQGQMGNLGKFRFHVCSTLFPVLISVLTPKPGGLFRSSGKHWKIYIIWRQWYGDGWFSDSQDSQDCFENSQDGRRDVLPNVDVVYSSNPKKSVASPKKRWFQPSGKVVEILKNRLLGKRRARKNTIAIELTRSVNV